MALSIVKTKYIAAASCATQAVWLRKMLNELQHQQDHPTTIFCNKNLTIALTKNPVFQGHSKHIIIKHHYFRDLVKNKEIVIEYCICENQIANIFTKPLKAYLSLKLKKMLGMKT